MQWMVCGLVLAMAGSAWAQSVEAESAFRDGKKLMAKGQYAEACDAFATSLRLAPGLATKMNLADCREKNGQLASAWGLFREVVIESRDDDAMASLAKVAKDRSDALEPRLSYLTISVPDESRVDGLVVSRNGVDLDSGLWNRAIPVDGGTYEIAAHAPAHEAWSTTVEIAAERGSETVDVPRFKELPVEAEPEPVAEERPIVVVTQPSAFTGRRKIAVVVGAFGVAALAAGGVLGWTARGLEDDAYDVCPQASCDDAAEANALVARAETRARYANIGYGVGAAALIGAAVLWLTGAPSPVEVAPTPTGVAFAGRF